MSDIARGILILLLVMIASACTALPVQYNGASTRPAIALPTAGSDDRELMSLIANARVGATFTHVDPLSALTSRIRVSSEYFSANGRSCRRFTQHFSNSATPDRKLACETLSGWYEIPVASIVE